MERALRSIKTVDLKIRPICHRLEERVRTHLFLCMLVYYVKWNMRAKQKPLLFEDEDIAGAQALRSSIIARPERLESAKAKDSWKESADGLHVQCFQRLLSDLDTLAKNPVRAQGNRPAEFNLLTWPTVPTGIEVLRTIVWHSISA